MEQVLCCVCGKNLDIDKAISVIDSNEKHLFICKGCDKN